MRQQRYRSLFARVALALAATAGYLLLGGSPASAAGCQFVLGFKAFHDENAAVVGDCTSNEQDGGGGTRVQYTANGLLVWRPADNRIAFTDGSQTWVKGPLGTQARANDARFAWEGKTSDAAPPVKRSHFMMHSPWPEEDPRWFPDSWVNYAVLFERSGYFIHDAPWRSAYGPGTNLVYNPGVGWVGTHGCVNVPQDAEAKLFGWADLGTPVTVMG
jgi:hypothetical protein